MENAENKRKQGRPALGTAPKIRLNLTVSEEVREQLQELSEFKKVSISELIADYAAREHKKMMKNK